MITTSPKEVTAAYTKFFSTMVTYRDPHLKGTKHSYPLYRVWATFHQHPPAYRELISASLSKLGISIDIHGLLYVDTLHKRYQEPSWEIPPDTITNLRRHPSVYNHTETTLIIAPYRPALETSIDPA